MFIGRWRMFGGEEAVRSMFGGIGCWVGKRLLGGCLGVIGCWGEWEGGEDGKGRMLVRRMLFGREEAVRRMLWVIGCWMGKGG
ncbi:unnamed protein product [Meloidogyne enterolobii]|uniref:Uncharacterized protein n=1 Tax=Meloidogyne enterolobii TaxID=390850 RepID=A0ACB0YIA4_MELEN